MSFFDPPIKPLPAGRPLPAIDAHGQPIRAGQLARVPVIPEWLSHDLSADEVVQLKAVEGKVMRIFELDAYGYVWFAEHVGEDSPWFCVRPCEVIGLDADYQQEFE